MKLASQIDFSLRALLDVYLENSDLHNVDRYSTAGTAVGVLTVPLFSRYWHSTMALRVPCTVVFLHDNTAMLMFCANCFELR